MSKKLKDIGVVSLFTVVSRVLGLVRDQVGGAIFGGSVFNDAFLTAFRIPNLFRRLLGEGALTAAFIPTLQEELKENGQAGAFDLLNKVASWLLLATGLIVALAMVAFSQSRLVPAQEDKWYLAADLTVIMFPYLVCICVAAALNATLNVLGHFKEFALSPIWLNVAMIASLAGAGIHFAHTKMGEVYWQCGGVLLGGAFQLGVPVRGLWRLGWRPRFQLVWSPRVRQIARLMAPGLFGTAIYQINTFVSGLLAYSLMEGSATLLFYANRLMELPIGVFAIAVSTVVYPLIAKHAVEQNFTAMAHDFHKGLRMILLINIPAAAGLGLLSEPVVRFLYQHGEFTWADTGMMAPLLTLFVLGLPFFSVVSLTVRAFYALKDMKTPVRIATIDFVLNLVLSFTLRRWCGAAGLVFASTAAIVVQTLLLQRALVKKLPGMGFAPLWPTMAKVVGATVVMSAAVWGAQTGLAALHWGRRADLITILAVIPLGIVVYGTTIWLLKTEGLEELTAALAKVRTRFSRR